MMIMSILCSAHFRGRIAQLVARPLGIQLSTINSMGPGIGRHSLREVSGSIPDVSKFFARRRFFFCARVGALSSHIIELQKKYCERIA